MCYSLPHQDYTAPSDSAWEARLKDKYGIAEPVAAPEHAETQTERGRREVNAILARVSKPVTL